MLKRLFVMILICVVTSGCVCGVAAAGTEDEIIDNMDEESDRSALSSALMTDGSRSGVLDGSTVLNTDAGLNDAEDTGNSAAGIIISVAIALAIIVLIIILVPKDRADRDK